MADWLKRSLTTSLWHERPRIHFQTWINTGGSLCTTFLDRFRSTDRHNRRTWFGVFRSGAGRTKRAERKKAAFSCPPGGREGRRRAVKWDNVMTSTSVFLTIFDTSSRLTLAFSLVQSLTLSPQFPPGRSLNHARSPFSLPACEPPLCVVCARVRVYVCMYVCACVRVCMYVSI